MKDNAKIKAMLWIVFIAFFLTCANCKKKRKETQHRYVEDPGTTTLTPQERLRSSWRVYAYQFKGVDIIERMDTINGGRARIEEANISYDYWDVYNTWRFTIYNNFFQFDGDGTNAFNPDEPYDITIFGSANPLLCKWFITPFRYNVNQTNLRTKWTITKLYGNELNIVLSTDSGNYKIFMKKH